MQSLLQFVQGPGQSLFEQLKSVNAAEFPEYVEADPSQRPNFEPLVLSLTYLLC